MPNIAILTGQWTPQKSAIQRGVYDFAQSLADWNLLNIDQPYPACIRTAQVLRADALIGLVDSKPGSSAEKFPEGLVSHLPCVTVHDYLSSPSQGPAISIKHRSIAELIIQHLQNIKYERVLWLWRTQATGIKLALEALFGDQLSELRLSIEPLALQMTEPEPTAELSAWFRAESSGLVIAEAEDVAIYVRRLARRFQRKVPHDLGLISLCDGPALALPGLSITSVVQPFREMGYQSARLTHRLLSGQPVSSEPVAVEVLNITCRSSSVESGQDLAIERAVRFIKENATRGITVSEVMAFQQTSRVTFERQFQTAMGCTPGEYIRQIKVQKACDMLVNSPQSIESIGKSCGYQSPAKFSSFFKRAMKVSPAAYRRQARASQG